MSDIALGDMARQNHGLRKKFETSLQAPYKIFINDLEKDVMSSTYGKNKNNRQRDIPSFGWVNINCHCVD